MPSVASAGAPVVAEVGEAQRAQRRVAQKGAPRHRLPRVNHAAMAGVRRGVRLALRLPQPRAAAAWLLPRRRGVGHAAVPDELCGQRRVLLPHLGKQALPP